MLSPYLESLTPTFCAEAPEAPALKVHERISRGQRFRGLSIKGDPFFDKMSKDV